MLALEAVAVAAYLIAIEVVRGGGPTRGRLATVLVFAAACRVVLLPSGMIQEVDAYRYLWDGQAVLQGVNPYVLSPAEAYESNAPPAVGLPPTGAVVYARINYPEVPTIYPPAAQGVFALSQLLAPWSLGAWKALVLVADIVAIAFLVAALRCLGRDPSWVVVHAWSPLALKELSNSLHLDAFVVAGLAIFVWAVVAGRLLVAFAALAWATLLKLFALALVPLLAVFAWARARGVALRGLSLFVGIAFAAYLPWLGAGWALFDGLSAFARGWQRNDSLFSIVSAVVGDGAARPVCGLLIVGLVAWATLDVARRPVAARVVGAALVVVVGIFLLVPTANPWYFTWTLPFLVFFPSRAVLLLSGLVLLYYADFYFLYRDAPEGFDLVRVVEYVPFFVVLLWEMRRGCRGSAPPSETGAVGVRCA